MSKLFNVSIFDQVDTGWQLANNLQRELFTQLMSAGKPLGDVVERRMYRGILTGLNEAFIINQTTRDKLINEEPDCSSLIKPLVRGEDLRSWYQENEGCWLIWIQNGWTRKTFPDDTNSEEQAWNKFSACYPALAKYLGAFIDDAKKRQNKGQFWWELNPCDYYDAFKQSKIFWPDIAKFPRFSWDGNGQFLNNTGYFLSSKDISLLGILQSRTCWFCITNYFDNLGERQGLIRYRHFTQYMRRLPIPTLTDAQREQIGTLAQRLTDVAQSRYEVRRKTAHRILHDLGNGPEVRFNQRLELWWDLSFPEFRAEVQKIFKRDIPLKDRDDWEELLRERATQIRTLTDEIVRLETLLNVAVYAVFDLNDEEIALIERETKYKYGEW